MKRLLTTTALTVMAFGAAFALDDGNDMEGLKSGVDIAGMDRSVDPGDDFFQYVNGTWLETTEIPGDLTRYGTFVKLFLENEEKLKAIVDEMQANPEAFEGEDAAKVVAVFQSFLDRETRNARGVEPLAPAFKRIAKIDDKGDLPEAFAELSEKYRAASPISFGVGVDQKDSDRYLASVRQSGLGLPNRDYYLNDGERFEEIRAAYPNYIAKLFDLAGIEGGAEKAERVIAIETAIAEAHWEQAELRDREKNYNLYDKDALKEAFAFDVYEFAREAGLPRSIETINVGQPTYVEKVAGVVDQFSIDDWKAYLTFHVIDNSAGFLTDELDEAQFAFRGKLLSGQQEQREDWKRALGLVNGSMGEALGQIYVARHFPPEAKARMDAMIENLRAAFAEGIDGLEWMGPETKQAAKTKLAAFRTKIGYPDEWEDYSDLEVESDDLYGNLQRVAAFNRKDELARLKKETDKDEWFMSPQTVNAYHNPSFVEIVFPAAILNPPFFNVEADDAVNYGAIGGVIGHEFSHGFDDQGRKYDETGNLESWWTEEDDAKYTAIADRLVAQYDEYQPVPEEPDLKVNGRLTLGENIGDLAGLTIAYAAYKNSLNGQEDEVIDGFTGDQRFFLGWAQAWRLKQRDEAARQQVLTDPHSPAQFRVNGVVTNMPQFYEAFGVEPGDDLYKPAEERIKVW